MEVSYTFNHTDDQYSTLLGVSANIVVADVPMPLVLSSLSRTTAVQFLSNSSIIPSITNGNLVRRLRSGNPGYLTGRPVLFGFENQGTVSELVEGLSIPAVVLPNNPSTSLGAFKLINEGSITLC